MAKGTGQPGDTRKLRRLIKGVRTAMLVTVGTNGSVHSRPMQPVQGRFEGDLWFFTSTDSQVTSDVRQNERVNVLFVDPGDELYVSIRGTASLVTDADRVREMWKPALKSWFPRGKKEPSLALLRVVVDGAEYWDRKEGRQIHLEDFAGNNRATSVAAQPAPAPVENRRPENDQAPTPGTSGAQG